MRGDESHCVSVPVNHSLRARRKPLRERASVWERSLPAFEMTNCLISQLSFRAKREIFIMHNDSAIGDEPVSHRSHCGQERSCYRFCSAHFEGGAWRGTTKSSARPTPTK